MDPGTAAVVGAGLQGLAGVFGSKGMSGNVQKHLAREQMAIQRAPVVLGMAGKAALLPLADKLLYLMTKKRDFGGQQFQAGDSFYNPGGPATPQYANTDVPDNATLLADYKPGMGGYDKHLYQTEINSLAAKDETGKTVRTTSGDTDTDWQTQDDERAKMIAKAKADKDAAAKAALGWLTPRMTGLGPVAPGMSGRYRGFAPGGIG